MKAERRHELQENSLVRGVRTFPEFWKDFGSKISLAVILVLLSFLLVRYWLNSQEQAKVRTAARLSAGRAALERFRAGEAPPEAMASLDDRTRQMMQMMAMRTGSMSMLPMLPMEAQDRVRQQTWDKTEQAVQTVLADSKDPVQQAKAVLLRGDLNLYWSSLAANASEAASQPASRPNGGLAKSAEDYLKQAKSDYEEVISKASALSPGLVTSARLGLAGVHENQGQRAEAIKIYEAIRRENVSELHNRIAEARVTLLTQLQSNPLIGPTRQPTTEPTTKNSTTQAMTDASSQPATDATPVAPTTTESPATTQAAPLTGLRCSGWSSRLRFRPTG